MAKNDTPPVIKLAQPGFDVSTAGDENLIYDSNWPLLKIYKQGSHKIGNATTDSVVVEHDLGFIPMFWYFANTPLSAWQNSGNVGIQARSEFMGPMGDGTMEIFNNRLEWKATPFGGSSGRSQLYYYIFALDITKQYTAPIIKLGGISGARGDRVFKIAKAGKSVDSDNLFDYVIHSRARSPLIHSVNPSPGAVKEFKVEHKLTYLPMFFGFEKTANGGYKSMPTGQGGSSSFQSDENSITFTDTGEKEISIVILKDPFQVSYSVEVSV